MMIPNETTADFMLQIAQALAAEIEVNLDGSEQSLQYVDDYLAAYSTKMEIPIDKTMASVAYVGNVMMANIGGSWQIDEPTKDIGINLEESYEGGTVSLIEWFSEEGDTSTPFVKPTVLYLALKERLGLSAILNTEPKNWQIDPCLQMVNEAKELVEEQTKISVEQIGKGVMLVFVLIAGADGEIDKKEIKAFNKYLTDKQGKRSELFKVAVGIMMNDTEMQTSTDMGSTVQIVNRLISVKESAEKFYPDQCELYCNELYGMAVDIVKSSGGFMGLNSIDEAESAALELIRMALAIK